MEKQRWEESEKGRIREEKESRERVRRKKMQVHEKAEKSLFTVFFQWCVAPEGRKVGSLKRRVGAIWPDERRKSARRCGAKHMSKSKCTKHVRLEALSGMEMSKKCTPLWREEHFQVKSVKNWWVQTTFGSWDVEKVHAVVARSTFPSQNVKSTTCLGHFWTFRCRFAWQTQGIVHLVKSE